MDIEFLYIGASTCVIEIDGKIKIGIDPALCPKDHELSFKGFSSKRVRNPIYNESTLKNIDIWLITHSHEDHLDAFGVDKISMDSLIISDKKTGNNPLVAHLKRKVLKWNNSFLYKEAQHSVKITAIPAYHGDSWFIRTLVGRVNGYLIEVLNSEGEKTCLYFTGDTVYHKDVVKRVSQEVDILIANLGNVKNTKLRSRLTMNISMLRQFEEALKPKMTIPIHVDDFSHYNMKTIDVLKEGYKLTPVGSWMTL